MHDTINIHRFGEIINRFGDSKVLVVGDIMVDQFIWGKVSRISPEAPVPVVNVVDESLRLGGCANVLNNIIAVGGRGALAGVIGSDEMGRWFIEAVKKRDVDMRGIIIEEGRPTTVKTRVVAHGQQMVRFDREKKMPIGLSTIQKIVDYVKSIKKDLGAIVISDYNKGVIFEQLIGGIKDAVAGNNIVLCVDPKQNDFSLYRGCDLITPNQHEAERALGQELPTEESLIQGGRNLLEQYGFKSVLITRGEEGMALFEKNGDFTIRAAAAKEVFDVTGAGDTVIGVFALSLAAGATYREATFLANQAAGIVVGKVGTATVTQEELKRVLA